MTYWKKSNEKEEEEVAELIYDLKSFITNHPRKIEGSFWVSALLFLIIQVHKKSDIPFEDLEGTFNQALQFYKPWYHQEDK